MPQAVSASHAHLLGRKGAARIVLIPPQVLQALNEGQVPTVNLNEFLAVDIGQLARHVANHIGLEPLHERLSDTIAMLGSFKPMKRHDHIARALYDMTASRADRDAVATALAQHPSDIARSWAAQWVGFANLPLAERLHAVRSFAADPHFGVREIAWLSVRQSVIAEIRPALNLLQPWVQEKDENLRRFASELTRPRGVWCAHIEALKQDPQRALPLLEPLRSDQSRYVQNSVGNWLNDAAKTQAAWVRALCARWQSESPTAPTRYIVRRALRSL
jgi:3-methyladenine DNA glycosylase AlkC